MQSNKSKKCLLSNSGNFNDVMNLCQVVSSSNLNHRFWRSLRDTINMKKESQSIKGRIFTAKRILTPIIQELMKDALEQIEADKLEVEEGREMKGKEVKVLYNNIKAKDIWHVQTDVLTDGEEWAMRILREISRDFEKPFDKLRENDEIGEIEERSSKDILLNKKLLMKLVAIHQHLGNIIERLKNKCKPTKPVGKNDDSLRDLRNIGFDFGLKPSIETQCFSPKKTYEPMLKTCNVNSFSINEPHEVYVTQSSTTCLYGRNFSNAENEKRIHVENACSPINFEDVDRKGLSMSKKLLFDVAVSYHALFEETKNNIGNKEIVIKCLEDLEKVRNYLEALRDNKECEKPKFSDLESCKNEECLESTPHLHSNLHNMPMVLKLNKHAEENERNSDLIIGIPSLTKSSPDVHILLSTKDQPDSVQEQGSRTQNQQKIPNRVSRIPKPIDKQRVDMGRFVKSNSMRITLGNGQSSREKAANFLIFDPDDPCKSIIKMKEQKNEMLDDESDSVVSKTCFKQTQRYNLIILVIFCCVGGSYTKLKVNICIGLLLKLFFIMKNSPAIPLDYSIPKLILTISIFLFVSSVEESTEFPYVSNIPEILHAVECKILRRKHRDLNIGYEEKLDEYFDNLFSFMSFIKGSEKRMSKHDSNTKCSRFYENLDESMGRTQLVYFFQCFKENKEKNEGKRDPPSQKTWDCQSENVASYPIWTIKRSKYYSVPESKTTGNAVLEKQIDDKEHEEPVEPLKLEEIDSLENIAESHQEVHMQISQVSVRSAELVRDDDLETGSDKMCKKTEVKRKVSFREEVDISGSVLDNQPLENQDLDPQDFNNLAVSPDCDQNYLDGAKFTLEKAPSPETQEDIKRLCSRISDLLMTDSLMKIGETIPKSDAKKLKQASKRSSPKNLKLTDSAKNVLARLSKSFEDGGYTSVSGTLDSDMIPQFYDEGGNQIAEVYNSVGDLLFSLKDNNIGRLASVLFDPTGTLYNNIYDVYGKRIKAVYDEDGRKIKRISHNNEEIIKSVQADIETVEYYDHRGKPLKHLYDSSGYEIKTVGKDLTSTIFDADGRLQMGLFTRKGRRIDAVYDSRGRLLARVSDSQLEPHIRKEHVRVANMDEDSLSKLFECGSKSVKFENEPTTKKGGTPKRFFDQEGNPLIGVYDKKGKPIKLTSSGEADELLPFLFDNKGKLQSKRYDSKGKELKAVFGEDGKAISEMSIAWLNELLANSKNDVSKTKKKESFFKRMSKSKTRTDKNCNIEKLYDSNGKIITSIFDAKGKPLAVTMSGDAAKLLPHLFDNGGKFIKRRYDSEKRKLRCVYGREGNVISTISVTYLNHITAKLENDQNQEQNDNYATSENDRNRSSPQDGGETAENMVEDTKSIKNLDCFDKIPDQLYDEDGNLLVDIFDYEGNVLQTSSSGNAWKLLPHLFDEKGKFLKKRFDKKGKELVAVYNKEGEKLNEYLSTAMKMTADEAFKLSEAHNDFHGENSERKHTKNEQMRDGKGEEKSETEQDCENIEIKHKQIKSKNKDKDKKKDSALDLPKKVSSISSQETSNHNVTEKKSSTSRRIAPTPMKEKHEKKQLKPTNSITKNQSINQKFDIPELEPKAGESIYRFFDEKGRPITEIYDYKGRALVRARSGDVEELAKFLFDKKGFLFENIYDRKGRRINRIFDQKRRSISRISVPSIHSVDNMSNKHHQKAKKLPGSVYDRHGNLVKEIYDRKGHPIMITRLAKLEDLAPIIFDEKGVRRRLYDKSGYEIGPVFDHKGNVLKHFPVFKKEKPKSNRESTRIFTKSGRPLHNLYDSEGTLIIALYNDYGKTLCNVKKGVDNVELLSKFFFDKEGHFLKGRFYNFRGQMIRHVYDSDCNIVRTIRRTESRRIAHHKPSNRDGVKVGRRRNTGSANKLNQRTTLNYASKHKQRGYHGRSEVRPVENIMGTFSSHSDTVINPAKPLMQRSMSAYSLRDYPVQQEMNQSNSSSSSSLANMSVKKFYDENGRLLTGVYNSKARLLGYSASGNARVLAPYLFDVKGKFISGRYNLDRRPLKRIYDSSGKLIEKISKTVMNKTNDRPKKFKDLKFRDRNGHLITSVYNLRGNKIIDDTSSFNKISNILDKNGKLKKNLFNCRGSELQIYNEKREIVRKISSNDITSDDDSDYCQDKDGKNRGSKGRFSALCNFKDKLLTVIFDNQNRLSQRLSLKPSDKTAKTIRANVREKEHVKSEDESKSSRKPKKSFLYDKNSNVISNIHDERGKVIRKLYDSEGKVISELYSSSGTLMKNNVLKNMFEKNVFRPKAFNSEGKIISTIYANKKLLKKVYDEKGEPAIIDSDLIYLVSKQSLPDDDGPQHPKPAPKQVNYFSEGSSYPFPEGQNQIGQIKSQQMTEEQNYETELEVAFNGYSRRRTDDCTCEHCLKMGKRKNIVQFGGEILDRLSRFTIPLSKFLPRPFLRRDESDEAEGELDSLETLIDKAGHQDVSEEAECSDKEYYGSCSKVLLESDENVPISRKMIEHTLRNCAHLNSSTNIVGKISDTVIQHFANLILQEIEQKFYHKLNVLQCRGNNGHDSSHAFHCDAEKDICIGTELKFEDSLIGKHISAQTTDLSASFGKCRICGSSLESLNQNFELCGYLDGTACCQECEKHKAFVCKVPNLQPFIMMMKSKEDTFGKAFEGN